MDAIPAKRALAVLDNPPATAEAARRISRKVRTAIDAMVSGECKTGVRSGPFRSCYSPLLRAMHQTSQ
jgi:hypothetical protein